MFGIEGMRGIYQALPVVSANFDLEIVRFTPRRSAIMDKPCLDAGGGPEFEIDEMV